MREPDPRNTPTDLTTFRLCSSCRKPIPFSAAYHRCSVSTCSRGRTALYFCSVPCWDAHLPNARHREAWAEEVRAPTRQEWQAEQAAALADGAPARGSRADVTPPPMRPEPVASRRAAPAELREVLVVVSKLKAYVRERHGFSTADAVADVFSDHLRRLCDRAVERARQDGRKTVLERDIRSIVG